MRSQATRLVGSVVLASLTATGLALDAAGLTASWKLDWRWFLLFGFVAFVGIVYWGWHCTSQKLRDLENAQPNVEVTPKCEGKFARLIVTNTGKYEASFRMKVSNWDGMLSIVTPPGLPYEARWKDGSLSLNLSPEESGEIELIQIEGQTLDEQGKENKDLRKLKIINSNHSEAKALLDSKLKLSVQVFASPRLRLPSRHTYILTVGNDNWRQFEELKNDRM